MTAPHPCPCDAPVRPSTAYRRGCRHEPARRWKARYSKRHATGRLRPAYTDGVGTARRLRALAALGWNTDQLAERLAMSPSTVGKLRRGTHPSVRREHAAAVAALYDRLWDQPGPSRHMRERAHRCGWAPALAWDDIDDPAAQPDTGPKLASRAADADPVAVDRVVRGAEPADQHDHATVTAAIARLDADGWTSTAIAAHLGVPVRRIERHRARRRTRTTTSGEAA